MSDSPETPHHPSSTPTPGMIPGAQRPAPAGASGYGVPLDSAGNPVEAPAGVAKVLIGVSAAYAVVSVILALFAQGDIERTRAAIETGELAFGFSTLISLLAFPLLVVSFVAYGMWMGRMRRNRTALGERPGLPAVEWWGWFVPFASVVLIPLGARKVTGRAVSLALLLGWWLTWTVAQALTTGASLTVNLAVDLRTGDLVRPELLDANPPLMWAAAAVTVIAWFAFTAFIRQATDRHLQR